MEQRDIVTRSIPVSQARQKLGELVNEVYKRHLRVVVEKSGIPVVAMVSLADFERWVRLDREQGRPDAKEAKVSIDRGQTVPGFPTEAETARRHSAVARILANADKRGTSSVTSTELIRQAREERDEAYGRWTH